MGYRMRGRGVGLERREVFEPTAEADVRPGAGELAKPGPSLPGSLTSR